MSISIQKAIADIQAYITGNDALFHKWYVGIAENPETRLFNDHSVNKSIDQWIYTPCNNSEEARSVEAYFHKLGTKGASGGGSPLTRYVYAYLINHRTRE